MIALDGWSAKQGTLARELVIEGRGLHTGRHVRVSVLPVHDISGAHEVHGIRFRRTDLSGASDAGAEIPVDPALRWAQPLCTMLRTESAVGVRTVEHLLAALVMCEIDHAVVALDAEELPILDGSATPWVDAIRACGRVELDRPKRFLRVLKPVTVESGGRGPKREMRIEPAPCYEVDVTNDLKGFGGMTWSGELTPRVFADEIAPSRSYGRIKWALPAMLAGYLKRTPILRGARLSCTASIVGSRVIGGMRMPDEFVRHRVLDLVGDMAMAGGPLLGRIRALRPCHEMNHRLVSALLSDRSAWRWESFPARDPHQITGR